MRHTITVFLLATVPYCVAVPGDNIAQGCPYVISQAPGTARSYSDATGTERYRSDSPYRGELTDGKSSADHDRAQVRWQIRYVPIAVTVELGDSKTIDEIRLSPLVALREGGSVLPTRIDVAVRSSQFPYPSWIQVTQWHRPTNAELSPIRISLMPVPASAVRVS
ncbi:MAG: hypothetical protein HON70_07155, partial [Lentisphaerae bacterium]|nr:hypothetical protein [Lentisphaerota bacterium]